MKYSDFIFRKPNAMSIVKRTLRFGVGINDADYIVDYDIDGIRYTCPIYTLWSGILSRSYSKSYHSVQPTYSSCTVDERWHSFMAFREWVLAQPEWEGLQLDKDLLIPGNKVYGPDTCVFISRQLNTFLAQRRSTNSGLPIGVAKHRKKWIAQCQLGDGTLWRSSPVLTIDEAALLYKQKKYELALVYIAETKDPRIASALLDRFAV